MLGATRAIDATRDNNVEVEIGVEYPLFRSSQQALYDMSGSFVSPIATYDITLDYNNLTVVFNKPHIDTPKIVYATDSYLEDVIGSCVSDGSGVFTFGIDVAKSSAVVVFSFSNSYIQNGYYSGFTAIVDRSTWKVLGCKGDYGQTYRWATDMTYDPSTNRFYGCFMNASETGYELGFMDVDDVNPAVTVNNIHRIATLPFSLIGIAADGSGTLWGITSNGQLVTINRKTGEYTLKANTGFGTRYNGSLTWDQNRNILYWAVCYDFGEEVRSAILAINPQTGAFSIVNNFNDGTAQFGALFADFAANDGAPGSPLNMAVNIEGFDYEGTVTFDAPTTLENGTEGLGALQGRLTVTNAETYVVAIDTTVDMTYGQTGITIPVTLTTPGNYIFSLTAVNADGPSYPVTITRYVGIDHPSPVGEITTTCEGGTFTASWDAVTAPLNGGYFNPDELVYDVIVRKSDDRGNSAVIIETTTAETSVSATVDDTTDLRSFRVSVSDEPIAETEIEDRDASIGGHYYRVTALYADGQLESAPTEEIYVFSRGMVGVDSPMASDGRVSILPGRIEVELDGLADVAVYDYNGRVLFHENVDRSATIPLKPGTYILTIDGAPLRVLVK